MLDRCNQSILLLVFGCLVVASVVNADGRVFVLDLRNSSGLQGFRDAEQACASQRARLASAQELRHAVLECYFSPCTRGWLHGGTVGTTVCNIVGGALKAVDVRTGNATEDAAHLDAFCIKDKGAPCGDPPSFPNARMQGQGEFEMGDELLYTCMPGYMMPNGRSVFSLMCDSCGEWYGLVQVCVKDKTESHVDYEDKFTDSYREVEHNNNGPEEAHGEVSEEVHVAAYPKGKRAQEQQETSLGYEDVVEHQDQQREQEVGEKVIDHGGKFEGSKEEAGGKDEADEDFIGHPRLEQEMKEVVKPAAATTEAPVSLLSQKHLFWFPSEAFQQEGQVSTNPVTQTPQRASGALSEESKEQESQERQPHQLPVDVHDHEQDSYEEHDTNDEDDHDDSHHDDQDLHEDSHHDDQDDNDSRQGEDGEDDRDDDSKHHVPSQEDVEDRRGHYENHDDRYDHYDMGEHEDDRGRVRYGTQDYDDRDDTYDEHESYEDHEDVTDDHSDDDQEHPGSLEEHPDRDDHDDGEEHHDPSEDSHDQADLDGHEHHDHLDDHEHHDHDNHDSHESHEDNDDGHQHVIFSIERDQHQNVTKKVAGATATTDDTWLDGYPVTQEETGKSDSTTEKVKTEVGERGTVVRSTDRPNEVEKPPPYTSFPDMPESPTNDSDLEQGEVEKVWPGSVVTTAPSSDNPEVSDSPSYSDTLDYDTQQAAPTHSWQGDLTEHPFLDQGPAPPMHDGDMVQGGIEEHTVHNLPGETGEREEKEGEMGEAICTGEDCPPGPPSSYSRGPTVAAIIAVLCVLTAAVVLGVWYYRRQQQKSSMYEMNGKGKSQSRQGQQIEMQQKV